MKKLIISENEDIEGTKCSARFEIKSVNSQINARTTYHTMPTSLLIDFELCFAQRQNNKAFLMKSITLLSTQHL